MVKQRKRDWPMLLQSRTFLNFYHSSGTPFTSLISTLILLLNTLQSHLVVRRSGVSPFIKPLHNVNPPFFGGSAQISQPTNYFILHNPFSMDKSCLVLFYFFSGKMSVLMGRLWVLPSLSLSSPPLSKWFKRMKELCTHSEVTIEINILVCKHNGKGGSKTPRLSQEREGSPCNTPGWTRIW